MIKLWNSSSTLAQVVVYYTRLYGAQILLFTILSAVTVYRREMSCNHVYTEDDQDRESLGRETVTQDTSPPGSCRSKKKQPSEELWDELVWNDLDGAGNYCSGEPLIAVLVKIWAALFLGSHRLEKSSHEQMVTSSTSSHHESPVGNASEVCSESKLGSHQCDLVSQMLPPDLQVQVLSYLHPRDVVTFACASHPCRNIVELGETSMVLWKTLWYRDYAWLVLSWEVGRQALQRSQNLTDVCFDKRFYFMFGQSYLDYVLAGKNSVDECLVGLHGNIYNLTPFLDSHPGSPETLLVYSGRDATAFFEDMGHSSSARRLSRSLCLVVDKSCEGSGFGVRPTRNIPVNLGLSDTGEGVTVPLERTRRPKRPGTLHLVRREYDTNYEKYLKRMSRKCSNDDVNVYYDPICMKWKAWFTDVNLGTVFLSAT